LNIFEVLASSKKGLPEEQVSVLLAWLINPYMDHGLNYLILRKLIALIDSELSGKLEPLLKRMRLQWRTLRSAEPPTINFGLDIEFPVSNSSSLIDIVTALDDYVFAIENKISTKSIEDSQQLKNQYIGLKEKFPERKIVAVFLVPDKNAPAAKRTFSELKIEKGSHDSKVCLSWEEIGRLFEQTLRDEGSLQIDPLAESIKRILVDFTRFIRSGFKGFPIAANRSTSGDNVLTEGRKRIFELNDSDYVGINYGIHGLLQMQLEEIESGRFQYTTANMNGKKHWIRANIAQDVARGIKNKHFLESIPWETLADKYRAAAVLRICKYCDRELYVGVRGGAQGLRNLVETQSSDSLLSNSWQVSTEKKNRQWIDRETFVSIVEPRLPALSL
jgi:PD-(D/E)XK nuclease superfamily